jgi:hypothetical protein
MARLLSAGEVRQILFEVVAEIARDSPAASIHVIGGAAMSCHHPEWFNDWALGLRPPGITRAWGP